MRLAERIGQAYVAGHRLHCARVPGRVTAEVAGLTIASLGLPEPWSTQVLALPDPPEMAPVRTAVGWCVERGLAPQVMVRAEHAERLPELGAVDELPVFVTDAGGEQDRLDVEVVKDAVEFQRVYAAAFGMRPGLAEALVTPADIGVPRLTFLVGRDNGSSVACAQLRVHDGLGYVSAVGVTPDKQRQGYGTAMLVAAGEEARRQGCELQWLHATATARPFYEAIGFELVDTHVALAAS